MSMITCIPIASGHHTNMQTVTVIIVRVLFAPVTNLPRARRAEAHRLGDTYRVSFSCWQQEIPTIATVTSGDISVECPSRSFQMTTQRPKREDRPLRLLVILTCLARFRLPESCYCNRTKNCVSLALISFFGGRGKRVGRKAGVGEKGNRVWKGRFETYTGLI